MADIYNDTISAGGNSGDLTVTVGVTYGIRCEGIARVEAKSGSRYDFVGRLGNSEAKVLVAPSSTIRVVNESGADNDVVVEGP